MPPTLLALGNGLPLRDAGWRWGVFPNPAALLRLAGAVLVEAHDEWQVTAECRSSQNFSMALLTEKKTDQEVAKPELMTAFQEPLSRTVSRTPPLSGTSPRTDATDSAEMQRFCALVSCLRCSSRRRARRPRRSDRGRLCGLPKRGHCLRRVEHGDTRKSARATTSSGGAGRACARRSAFR